MFMYNIASAPPVGSIVQLASVLVTAGHTSLTVLHQKRPSSIAPPYFTVWWGFFVGCACTILLYIVYACIVYGAGVGGAGTGILSFTRILLCTTSVQGTGS